jgi:hypothetical protein
MRADEYLRLQAACVAMARQSQALDVRVRWAKLADAAFVAADAAPERKIIYRTERHAWAPRALRHDVTSPRVLVGEGRVSFREVTRACGLAHSSSGQEVSGWAGCPAEGLRPRKPSAATNPFHTLCDFGGLGGRQCLIRGELVSHLLAFCVSRRWFTRRKPLACAASQAQPGGKCCADKLLHRVRRGSGDESIDEKEYDDDG